MSDLRAVVGGKIWIFERPVWFSGVRQRVNTTVVRLDDGSLLLHSPARSLRAILERPAQRLIVGHTDVMGENCREQLAQAWRLEGVEV